METVKIQHFINSFRVNMTKRLMQKMSWERRNELAVQFEAALVDSLADMVDTHLLVGLLEEEQ